MQITHVQNGEKKKLYLVWSIFSILAAKQHMRRLWNIYTQPSSVKRLETSLMLGQSWMDYTTYNSSKTNIVHDAVVSQSIEVFLLTIHATLNKPICNFRCVKICTFIFKSIPKVKLKVFCV